MAFLFTQLFFLAVAGILWDQAPSRTWVLLIGLAPLLLRLLARRRPIPRTLLDLPLFLFLLSAGIGIVTSYDPRGAYAASPWMPPASQWIVGLVLGGAGVLRPGCRRSPRPSHLDHGTFRLAGRRRSLSGSS